MNPAPARVAADVDHRRAVNQPVMPQPFSAGGNGHQLSLLSRLQPALDGGPIVEYGPSLIGDGGGDVVDQGNVPGSGHRDVHRKHSGGPSPDDSVQALVPAVHD